MKKLKSAEEYLQHTDWSEKWHWDIETEVEEIIKQAQLDTIQSTVERCAEEAEVNILNKHPKNAKITIVEVDKQSILNVAAEMKGELNEAD